DTQYIITFAVMLLVALTISTMTARIRSQAEITHQREQRTASLYKLSREFASSQGTDELIHVAARHISQVFDSQVAILLSDSQQHLMMPTTENFAVTETIEENIDKQGLAQWVYENRKPAGAGTEVIPGARGFYLPLVTSSHVIGVLVIYPRQRNSPFSREQQHFLEVLANQTALAIEKASLAVEAEASRIEVESERLRNSLLSSISHDLRTPLASITGAASSLLQKEQNLDLQSRQELHQIIYEEADRLNRLVGNLLDMTRIESGGIHVKKEWELLEEVIGSTLLRMKKRLSQHQFRKKLPEDLLLVPMDSILIEQVLVNLVDNAVKYSPAGTQIELEAEVQENEVVVIVADRGAGIPPGSEERIFEKFHRAAPENIGGVGLG
ncbi:MAG TPA: histidine kinase dimerization/phospho-acceptor domain-containing protein, partial [Aggregatilineales bacterium]|nr:histidine kinase dimerization/phospho-acceptor domain-containing protein [Aggregatilineales bacterium]